MRKSRILAVPVGGALILVALLAGLLPASAQTGATAGKVTVGSPSGLTPRNHQNEPAVAIDANDLNVLVAGVNDFIDNQPCPHDLAVNTGSCLPGVRPNVGVSGVYFSFDRGQSWTQPTYTGWTARDCPSADGACPGHFGPIGTLPWYYESGLVSFGDPAVAIGPRPGSDGTFSWANGSRVYYANLAANFGHVEESFQHGTVRGLLGVAVSRLDNPTPDRVAQKSSWMPPSVVIQRSGTFSLEDKEQIWADNAASSPFFGHVYTCNAQFRALTGSGVPVPIMVASSADGGTTWAQRQIPGNSGGGSSFLKFGFLDGCTIRTDSHGVVYLFLTRFGGPAPSHAMFKSFDGGVHWTAEQDTVGISDPCFFVDPVEGRCVMDGYAGARIDLSAAPSVDVANGAPTGQGATNAIVDAWSDGRQGLNNEKTLVSWSTDGGNSWATPVTASVPGDRSMYSAPAISPDGSRLYVIYEGATAPWRGADMLSPRPYHGVFRSAAFGPSGPGGWATLFDGPLGDLRGTYPGHDIYQERVGDYVYAAASAEYGVGVWTDARDAAVCGPVQQYRSASLAAGTLALPAPWPLNDCPAGFGNTDIWSATTG
ncbi:MAG: sialidase family protein [Micromonosporaceae bacterium]